MYKRNMKNDTDHIELAEGGENNPMHFSSTSGGASDAYLESVRRARESKEWKTAQVEASGGYNRGRMTAGFKTKATIVGLMLSGIVLFLVGASFYFDTSNERDERKTGLDILLCSSIPLLPGSYGSFIWWAETRGWQGYSTLRLGRD